MPHAGQDGAVEHFLQVLLRQRGAFSKRDSADAPGAQAGVVSAHWFLLAVRESDQHLDVLPQVALGAHEDDGNARTEAMNLGGPAGHHAPEGGWKNHAVAEQEDISFTVTEWTEALKLILKTEKKKRETAATFYLLIQILWPIFINICIAKKSSNYLHYFFKLLDCMCFSIYNKRYPSMANDQYDEQVLSLCAEHHRVNLLDSHKNLQDSVLRECMI